MSELGQRIKHKVQMIAAGNPDFIYEKPADSRACVYVDIGAPSCIIGRALWNLNLIDESLEESRFNTFDIRTLLDEYLDIEIDEDEAKWLASVQLKQDWGWSWGHSVGIS
ncbi:hypothetical protein [Mycobacterium phage WXIN]|nr:hypothetical protein [Mycobacterium phage WXIN]